MAMEMTAELSASIQQEFDKAVLPRVVWVNNFQFTPAEKLYCCHSSAERQQRSVCRSFTTQLAGLDHGLMS